MPNHIFNTIKFKREDREKFAKFMEKDSFDFNKLIPKPKEFEEMGGDRGEKEEILKEWEEFTKDVSITPSNVDEYIEKFRKEVRENPEKYPQLTIRVSGYAVRFNSLTKEQQQDVITRTFTQTM